ncbi:MAG TPA: tetratricopeptide repeat protein [Anaerohalosphaeraceae bacterium]|nr:tetratricopeptide repeat protein [Anaerohalosphaeraceae bacterium]HOL88493.1 tetratricopeptide repeat protein [Anaerohalosphaeraceae bacterium]HPP56515.1 tetratricopeptide repeat protein [Anaerohalosphaeraceae bacterium]
MSEKNGSKKTPYELFASPISAEAREQELFAGKPPRRESAGSVVPPASTVLPAEVSAKSSGHQWFWILFLLILNSLMVGGVVCYLLFVREKQTSLPQTPAEAKDSFEKDDAALPPLPKGQEGSIDPSVLMRSIHLSSLTRQTLDDSVSLRSAEALYRAKDYFKASYVFGRLRENLMKNNPADACLDDYLSLKMALCLQKTQEQETLTALFGQAVESRSPVVRALAYYYLCFLQMHNRQFLEARKSAYRALSLMSAFDATMPATAESDCYFAAAEALMRAVLKLGSESEILPGPLWTDTLPIAEVPLEEPETLKAFLMRGFEEINEGAVGPKIVYRPGAETGSQWTAVCLKSPLEEVLWKYGSAAGVDLEWNVSDAAARQRPVTLYLPSTAGTYLAELAAGSAGLLWSFDGASGRLYDPETYSNFEEHKAVLLSETIAIWQRFLLRYRGEHRAANAHYALGVLYTMQGQTATALGEFKLVSSRHPHHPLAPYALAYSSRLRTDLGDFEGARADLNDLVVQYPENRAADEAWLYLAEASAKKGLYEAAQRLFEKVYRLNFSASVRYRAAYGLGLCAYESGDYEQAQRWLNEALELMEQEKNTQGAGSVLHLLGRVCLKRRDYDTACQILKAALNQVLTAEEIFQVKTELIEAKIAQRRYVEALEMLEEISESRLSQKEVCDFMLLRSRILREMDLADSAASLLRRKREFIADAGQRARLGVELARCYLQSGDWTAAEKELTDALYDLEGRSEMKEAMFLLAETAYQRGRLAMAEDLCRQLLTLEETEFPMRQQIFALLGRIYEGQKRLADAALAYGGIVPEGSGR